jgi:hypothetical protein
MPTDKLTPEARKVLQIMRSGRGPYADMLDDEYQPQRNRAIRLLLKVGYVKWDSLSGKYVLQDSVAALAQAGHTGG